MTWAGAKSMLATMANDVSDLPGLGPRSRQMLASVGMTSVAQLHCADLFELYAAIKRLHAGASLNLLYALIAAVEGRDWREVARSERTSVVLRLDEMGLPAARPKRERK